MKIFENGQKSFRKTPLNGRHGKYKYLHIYNELIVINRIFICYSFYINY